MFNDRESPEYKKWKGKWGLFVLFYLILPAVIIFVGHVLFEKTRQTLFYTPQEKKVLSALAEKRKQTSLYLYRKKYGHIEDKIHRRHPEGFTFLAFMRENKLKTAVLFGLGFMTLGGFAYLWRRKLKNLDENFFYQKGEMEEYMKYGKPEKVQIPFHKIVVQTLDGRRFVVSEKNDVVPLFKSFQDYVKFLSVIEANIINDERALRKKLERGEITEEEFMNRIKQPTSVRLDYEEMKKDVVRLTKAIVEFGIDRGKLDSRKPEEVKMAIITIAFSLLHKITSFYGNAPLGLLDIFIKDYTLKRVLSYYPFKKTFSTRLFDQKLTQMGLKKDPDELARKILLTYGLYFKTYPEEEKRITDKYEQIDTLVILNRIEKTLADKHSEMAEKDMEYLKKMQEESEGD